MKKIFIFIAKLLCWTFASIIGGVMMLAFIIGLLEGDLSHGIGYYLN